MNDKTGKKMKAQFEALNDGTLVLVETGAGETIGVKAKAGFYRGAKLLLAATGPVRAGGAAGLRPAPGGGNQSSA